MYRPWYTQCAQMLLSCVQHPAYRRLSHKGDRLTVEARIHPNVLFERQGQRRWAGVFFVRSPPSSPVDSRQTPLPSYSLHFPGVKHSVRRHLHVSPDRTRNPVPFNPQYPSGFFARYCW